MTTKAVASWAVPFLLVGCCIPLPGSDEPPPPVPSVPLPTGSAPPVPSAPPGAPATPGALAPAAMPAPVVHESELRARKVAEYSRHCLNQMSDRAFRSRQRYLSWAAEGPTARRAGWGVPEVSGNIAGCRAAIARAQPMPPAMPEAEAAAVAYADAVAALMPITSRANQYYEREMFRDDDLAQGREMHGPLVAAYTAFATAHQALFEQVIATQRAARRERIARMENDPSQRSSYLIERTIAQADDVFQMAQALRIEGSRYVSDDAAALIQAVETLRLGTDELAAYSPSSGGEPRRLDEVRSEANEYLETALALMRRVRDGDRFSTGERMSLGNSSEWMVRGSVGRLERDYNELVDAYNSR